MSQTFHDSLKPDAQRDPKKEQADKDKTKQKPKKKMNLSL